MTKAENDAARERFSKAYEILGELFDDILTEVLQGKWPAFIGKYPQSIDIRLQDRLRAQDLDASALRMPEPPPAATLGPKPGDGKGRG